jgi:hypothetical protein
MKIHLKLFFAFVTVSFLCATCKKVKNNEIDASIYVKQYKTNTPIANAKILITRGTPGSGIGSTVVDSLFTDANGKATYNKTVDKNYMYYAEVYKDKYFDTHNQQVSVTRGEKNFTTTIFMFTHSYVKLHIKDVTPFNQFDLIKFNSGCYTYSFQGIIDSTFLWCDNCNCAWFGNYSFQAGAFITKNSINSTQQFSFTPTPFDTLTININY